MLHFTLPEPFLENSKTNTFNAAYYMNGYYGLANLTAAGQNNFFVSKPRFLDADPSIIANMSASFPLPNVQNHDTYLNVEPISGATMQAAKRLQLNVKLQPVVYGFINPATGNATGGIIAPFMKNSQILGLPFNPTAPPTVVGDGLYMPVFWAEEYAEISDSDASSFKTSLYGAQRASWGIYIAGEVLGCVMIVLACVLFWVSATRTGPEQPFSVTANIN
jgi:hypothetical protein